MRAVWNRKRSNEEEEGVELAANGDLRKEREGERGKNQNVRSVRWVRDARHQGNIKYKNKYVTPRGRSGNPCQRTIIFFYGTLLDDLFAK